MCIIFFWNVLSVTRSTPTHTALRKTNSFQQSVSDMTEDSLRRSSDDSFVVHRSKNIPTLSSVQNDDSQNTIRSRSVKTGSEEKVDSKAAGKPSNWNEQKKPSFAGRRSRRNSTSDDSQLTIENFGGSQDNLNFIGRNPDKEVRIEKSQIRHSITVFTSFCKEIYITTASAD